MRRIIWGLTLCVAACATKDERPPLDIVTVDTEDSAAGVDTGSVPPDGNDDLASASDQTGVSFDAEATSLGEGVINPAGDADFYTVRLTAGELYFFWADSGAEGPEPGDLDSVMTLFNADGDELVVGDDMIYLLYRYDAGLYFAPTTTGDYTLRVQEYGDYANTGANGGSGYTYTVFGTSLGPAEATDPGADAGTAAAVPLTPNTPFSSLPTFHGRLLTEGDEDWFSFTVPADAADPAVYAISFWPGFEPISPVLAVLDDEGNAVTSTEAPAQAPLGANGLANGPDQGAVFRGEPGRTYYVTVRDQAGAASDGTWVAVWSEVADLDAEPLDEAGDAMDGAYALTEALQPDASASFYTLSSWGWLEAETPVDWYVVRAADLTAWESGFVSVWLRATTVGSSVDAKVTLYDAEGAELAVSTEDTFSGTPDPLTIDLATPEGDLYIKVEAEEVRDPTTARGYLLEMLSSDAQIGQ